MRCAEGQLRHNRPLLCDFASRSTSPVTACSQYYSALLRGHPEAMRIVWQSRGHANFNEFATQLPCEVIRLRRIILVAAASLKRRHGHLAKPPYSFASL
eukprot:2192565-Pyramimonas_sp.AAC.1